MASSTTSDSRASMARSSGVVTASGPGATTTPSSPAIRPEREAGGVQDLDGQAPADLHLALVEGRVGARSAPGRPVADGVGPVLLHEGEWGHHVTLRLGHLLAVGIQHPAGDGGIAPGKRAVLQLRADDRREQPGTDDLVGLGADVHGEDPGEQIRVVLPPAGDLGGERGGGPGVHHVGIADEPTGPAPLVLAVPFGGVRRGVDGQPVLGGEDRSVEFDLPVGIDRVPDGEGNAEEALPADVPVAVQALDPGPVTMGHVGRVPTQLLAAGQQPVP